MRTLFVDAFSGISGNMFIGSLLDLGLKSDDFLTHLEEMGIHKEEIFIKKVMRQGISATYFNLQGEEEKLIEHDHEHDCTHEHDHTHEHRHSHGQEKANHQHCHRNLKDVLAIIDASSFTNEVKNTAKKIFTKLAEAEAGVHGTSISEVHFHEVGELDSIVDCLGAAYFFHCLEIDKVVFSTINTGSGMVKCAHGNYPIPTPATSLILSKIQAPIGGVYQNKELTTPTGAAIVAALYDEFQMRPQGRILGTGYGAGTRDNELPNVLRVLLLEEEESFAPVWYSCNVDDMTGEDLGFLMEKLFEKGARDVSYTPIFMKKNRPGQRIDVLGDTGVAQEIKRVLFRYSTTLGIKEIPIKKYEMDRFFEKIPFLGLEVSKKTAKFQDITKSSLEFEDVKKIAEVQGWTLNQTINKINQHIDGLD